MSLSYRKDKQADCIVFLFGCAICIPPLPVSNCYPWQKPERARKIKQAEMCWQERKDIWMYMSDLGRWGKLEGRITYTQASKGILRKTRTCWQVGQLGKTFDFNAARWEVLDKLTKALIGSQTQALSLTEKSTSLTSTMGIIICMEVGSHSDGRETANWRMGPSLVAALTFPGTEGFYSQVFDVADVTDKQASHRLKKRLPFCFLQSNVGWQLSHLKGYPDSFRARWCNGISWKGPFANWRASWRFLLQRGL